MDLRTLLAYSGLLLGLIIIPALLMKRGGHRIANRLLAIALALQLTLPVTVILGLDPMSLGTTISLLLSAGRALSLVLLIGYIRLMIDPDYRLRAKSAIYALPFLLLTLVVQALGVGPESMDEPRASWPPSPTSIVGILFYLLHLPYLLYADWLIRQHRRHIEHHFSSKSGVDLRGIHWCIRLLLVLITLGLLFSLMRLIPGVVLWPRLLYSIAMTVVLYYLIALLAFIQPNIFDAPRPATAPTDPEPPAAAEPSAAKYETSTLTDASAEQQWQRLRTLLEEEKPWLKNDLRLSELAELAQLPAYQLSQVINQCAGKNFFELMNGYRLEQAKRLLADNPSLKIAAIALESGYNSQSVFYKHFKQATGLTPSEFRRPKN